MLRRWEVGRSPLWLHSDLQENAEPGAVVVLDQLSPSELEAVPRFSPTPPPPRSALLQELKRFEMETF